MRLKNVTIMATILLILVPAGCNGDDPEDIMTKQWTVQQAQEWWDQQPWLVGCNFIPSTAINQLEMWQADTFDPETIDRELEWAADIGFNIIRVYLHDLVWEQEPEAFLDRMEQFLSIADQHDIKVMFVIFDDVWNTNPQSGPQPHPYLGRHNSGWVQSPGLSALEAYAQDETLRERLERYVKGVVSTFAEDARILIWDLYNEPGGYPSPIEEPVGEVCLPLLKDVFTWVREVNPSQPMTSGLWWHPLQPNPPSIAKIQLEQSDIVSFHHYGNAEDLRQVLDELEPKTDRPLLCTEYLARPLDSRFETHLPIFKEYNIGAINWGLVSGKTQTIYPWWSWFDEEPQSEPEVWLHDILRSDGTPFEEAETNFIRNIVKEQER